MLPVEFQTYVPVLRLKEGEYRALGELAPAVLDRILPHFVLPPPKERDPELGRALLPEEIPYVHGRRVGVHWPLRTCLLDARFLFAKLGADTVAEWLPDLFKLAEGAEARPIPVASLRDLEGPFLSGFQGVVKRNSNGFALRLTLDDLVRPDLASRTQAALLRLVLKPSECILLLDFAGAELSSPEAVAEIIVASYQRVMEIGLWHRVVFQATSYPEKNPAISGGQAILPRNEWSAWKHAAVLDQEVQRNLIFGDFGADCSKFAFSSGGSAPIKHYRYSTPDHWLVIRATDAGVTSEAMKDVSSRIVKSGHFSGRSFSRGDAFIEDTANGAAGPGNATTWRKVNTVHHLSRVVKDVGDLRGYTIADLVSVPPPTQPSLFDLEDVRK